MRASVMPWSCMITNDVQSVSDQVLSFRFTKSSMAARRSVDEAATIWVAGSDSTTCIKLLNLGLAGRARKKFPTSTTTYSLVSTERRNSSAISWARAWLASAGERRAMKYEVSAKQGIIGPVHRTGSDRDSPTHPGEALP